MILDKIKILTKIKDFKSVQKSLQDVELKLNMLKEAVNKPAELETDEKKGKTGDTNIHRGRDGNYRLNIRTKKGWESPTLKPHYDSGWTSIGLSSHPTFNHHLGSRFLLLQIYFKITEDVGDVKIGDIFNISNMGIDNYDTSPYTGDDTGINVEMSSNNTITIHTANHVLLCTDTGAKQEHDQGDIRIFAWKIGIRL